MNKYIPLSKACKYSSEKIKLDELTLSSYITTDNILQNKQGVKIATNLPPQGNSFPKYNAGNILVGNIRPYLRKIWYADNDGGCSADVLVFDVKKGFYPEFVYYTMFQDDFFIHTMKGSKGTKMPRGDKNQIMEYQIPDIDFNSQKKIASVLSALDTKIALNNRINAELEAMAKTVYDYWFVQFDFPFDFAQGKPSADGKQYKSSGGKMVWSEELKREVPEGWEVGIIGDYCPSTGGFAFKSEWWNEKGVSVVKIKDIQENYTIDLSDLAKVDLSDKKVDDKFKAKAGDILIAMTGATVGKYAIVPKTDYPIYVNQRVGFFNLGLESTKRLPFLINSMNQSYFREAIFTLASGAAQPNISNEQINNIQLIKPVKEIVNLYNSQMESIYQKILNNQQENQRLSSLRDWLLPMLMNGQVKVGSGYEGEVESLMAAENEEGYGGK